MALALEVLSLLYTFENFSKCLKISFDSDFFRIATRSIMGYKGINCC